MDEQDIKSSEFESTSVQMADSSEIISRNFDYSWEACLKNFGYHGRNEQEKDEMDWWKPIVKSVYIQGGTFLYFAGLTPFMSHFSTYFYLEFTKAPVGYPTLSLRRIPRNLGFKVGERVI